MSLILKYHTKKNKTKQNYNKKKEKRKISKFLNRQLWAYNQWNLSFIQAITSTY